MASNKKEGGNSFYLPEERITLKVVFDNLRNYAIIGGIVGLAHWVDSGKLNLPTALLPKFNFPHGKPIVWAFLALAMGLLAANAIQTFLMIGRIATDNADIEDYQRAPFTPRHLSWWERIWDRLQWFAAIAFALTFAYVLINFAMYLVLFASVGGR